MEKWTRKNLKQNAKQVLKHNYFGIVITCVLVMIIIGNFTNPITAFESVKDAYFSELNNTALFDENETGDLSKIEFADNAKQDTVSNPEIVSDFMGEVGVDNQETHKWTNGAIAMIINNSDDTDSLVYGILNTINQLVFHNKFAAGILIAIGTLIYALISIFFTNVIRVGYNRYLLENRAYQKTKLNRIMFAWSVKKEFHIAWVMLVRKIYLCLWWLTVVGGIIKSYSYRLVPIILAENPTLSAKEAITLSRQMMNGHKWRVFWLDVSFFGWKILSGFTFAILDIFFLQPYISLTNTELYMALRKDAKYKNTENADLLCDTYLEVEPCKAVYPVDCYIIPTVKSRKWIESDYNRNYSISSLLLIFFSFSFIGWIWEVSLHLFKNGVFVNRGVCYGPWLPIYGFGGVIVLIALKKFRNNPALTFVASMFLSGIVEYFTSWYLEVTNGMKWWDYSGYFLNINGRICMEGLLVFALAGCMSVYLVAPALDNLFKKIPDKHKRTICTVLIMLFVGDQICSNIKPNSGFGITDYD